MARPTKIISDFDICLGKVVKSKRVKAGLSRTPRRVAEKRSHQHEKHPLIRPEG